MAVKPFTNEQLNFFKFSTLVLDEFPKVLRQIFTTLWDSKVATRPGFIPWDDSPKVRNMLLTSEGGKTDIPTTKSIEEWDCTALFKATIYAKTFGVSGSRVSTLNDLYLKKVKPAPGTFHLSVQSSTGNQDETYTLAIDQLRLLRNTLCHSSELEIVKPNFDHNVQLVIDALTAVNIDTSFVAAIGQMGEEDFPTAKVQELNECRVKELQVINMFLENVEQKLSSIEERNAKIDEIHTMLTNTSLEDKGSLAVGERVIARWTNNKYYAGKVSSFDQVNRTIDIAFDDGDAITHKTDDVSAVILDQEPDSIKYKDHVIVPFQGGDAHITGFVTAVCTLKGFQIRFDNNNIAWFRKKELRIFPDASSPHEVGARVFARWWDGFYYRGFVSESADHLRVLINFDKGVKINLSKIDRTAVVLDKIPSDGEVVVGQRLIGYWPKLVAYFPGHIFRLCDSGKSYYLVFDHSGERFQEIFEIRTF